MEIEGGRMRNLLWFIIAVCCMFIPAYLTLKLSETDPTYTQTKSIFLYLLWSFSLYFVFRFITSAKPYNVLYDFLSIPFGKAYKMRQFLCAAVAVNLVIVLAVRFLKPVKNPEFEKLSGFDIV